MADIIKKFITKVGYSAFIIKHPECMFNSGYLCGYVNIPPEHPWYGKHYTDRVRIATTAKTIGSGDHSLIADLMLMADDNDEEPLYFRIDYIIGVHGGITYSNRNQYEKESWCFGFDCDHYGDSPKYWTVERVTEELEWLAKQLKEYESSAKED